MFWSFVVAAVRFRRRRLALAFSAMVVAAALATALLNVYADMDLRIRAEFRGYGANLVIAPVTPQRTVSLDAVAEAERLGARAAPFLFFEGRVNGQGVVVSGVDFKRVGPFVEYWRYENAGKSANAAGRSAPATLCLAGTAAAARFHLRVGDQVKLDGGACVLSGIIGTGGPEDNQLLLPLDVVEDLAGVHGRASIVQVRADGGRLDAIRGALAKALPDADIRLVRAVADTESNVVLKVRNSVFLLSFLILAITTLCVTSNFSELVIERSKEIGVLKAIGAAEGKIAALLVPESVMLAAVSTAVGYVAGLLLAGWIGRGIFAVPFAIRLDFSVLLYVGIVILTVAVSATLWAARRIWRIDPAIILRGE